MIEHQGISRRRFFQQAEVALYGVMGTALGVDVVYASRVFEPQYAINHDVLDLIDQTSFEMAPHIRYEGFDRVFTIQGRQYIGRPNSLVWSQMLAQMAYSEGKEEELGKTRSLLANRGLEIAVRTLPNHVYARVVYGKDSTGPIRMEAQPWVIEDYFSLPTDKKDNTFWHELYHVLQYARDPNFSQNSETMKLAGLLSILVAPSLIAAMRVNNYLEKLKKGESKLVRGDFLIIGVSLGFMGAAHFLGVPIPYEFQAHLQTESTPFFKGILVRDSSFEKLRGKLLDFEEK